MVDSLAIPAWQGLSQQEGLVSAWLSGRSGATTDAYGKDLADFASFVGVADVDSAAKMLLSQRPGRANAMALAYRSHLLERGLAPATINRRLASLRSLAKLGRMLGVMAWSLEVENVRSQSYRDTSGPGVVRVQNMLECLEARRDYKGKRDVAILRLLFDLGLRRSEVTRLDLEDLDLEEGTIRVIGKGRLEKETLSLPEATQKTLRAWIMERGAEPGPLFTSCDRAGKRSQNGRLDGSSVYRLVRKCGEKIGIRTRPHGIRHTSITEACKAAAANNLDLTEVCQFSRHQNVSTLQVYRDKERDVQGQLAGLVAAAIQ